MKKQKSKVLGIRLKIAQFNMFEKALKAKQRAEKKNKQKKTKVVDIFRQFIEEFIAKEQQEQRETLDSMLLKEKADKLARRVENIVKFDLLSEKPKE